MQPKQLDPKRKRRKAGARGGTRAVVNVGATSTAILRGEADLSVWDEEELRRGQRKVNGVFRGRPPAVVPKAIHDELVRRQFEEAHRIMHTSIRDAARVLRNIIIDERAENSDRLRAISLLFDRVLGKPKETIDLNIEQPPWLEALKAGIVGEAEDVDIVDAEIVEDE